MRKKKKVWTAPLLTVLVKRKLEERILLACKYGAVSGPIPAGGACDDLGCLGSCDAYGVS